MEFPQGDRLGLSREVEEGSLEPLLLDRPKSELSQSHPFRAFYDPSLNPQEGSAMTHFSGPEALRGSGYNKDIPAINDSSIASNSNDFEDTPLVWDADPIGIKDLWQEMLAYIREVGQSPKAEVSGSETSCESNGSIQFTFPSPYDHEFVYCIFGTRSIEFGQRHNVKAHNFFEVDVPIGNRARYYTETREAPNTSIWLEADDDFVDVILREYERMHRRRLCEAEYRGFAVESVFKRVP